MVRSVCHGVRGADQRRAAGLSVRLRRPRNDRSLEVPAWMFEPALCDHLRVAEALRVDGQALIELKAVLQTALRADVLEAQHYSLTANGGADATVQPPITSLATDAVSPAA